VVELEYCIVAVPCIETYIDEDIEYLQSRILPVIFNGKVSIWRVFGTTGKLKVKATFMLLYLNYRPTVTVLKFRNILPFKF
jgi:hypothetical protein